MQLKILLIGLLTSISLFASTQTDALLEMSLEELLNIEIDGATKTKQSILSVPASVSVFTHKEIQELGVSTLEELKNYVPGFASFRNENNSLSQATSTRGFKSGNASQDILVLMDGQRLNTDWDGGTTISNSNIALENIDKVEFIRGAASSIYGSNAFSGVINLVTIKGANALNVKGSTTALNSSALVSVKENSLEFNGFIKKVMDSGVNYTNLQNYDPSGPTDAKDSFETLEVYAQTSYKDLTLLLSHKELDTTDFYVVKYLSPQNKRRLQADFARLSYDLELSDMYKTKFSISYMENKSHFNVQIPIVGTTLGDIEERTISYEWFNNLQLTQEQSLQFGVEYFDKKVTQADSQYPDMSSAIIEASRRTPRNLFGSYIQYEGTFFEDVIFSAGARYDNYSDYGDSLNPRASLVYKAFDKTSFKLLYASAFRAPSKLELDTINNPNILGNKNLCAEAIDSYEFIVVQQYETQTLSASLFRNKVQNIITTVSTGNTTPGYEQQVKYQNAGEGTFDGVELEYNALIFNALSTRVAYSYTFNKPAESFRTPKQIASAILNYNYEKYNANLSGYVHDSVENDYAGVKKRLPSYAILNTKLSYRYEKDATLYIYAKNLLNKEFFSPSADATFTLDLPNRGREIYLGFEYSF